MIHRHLHHNSYFVRRPAKVAIVAILATANRKKKQIVVATTCTAIIQKIHSYESGKCYRYFYS